MRSILIIDDEHTTRVRYSSLLRRVFPHTQVHAVTAGEATRFLKNNHNVGLITCDLAVVGRGTALSRFESLRRRALHSPILLHCGCRHSDFDLLSCLSVGARGFLPKNAPLREYLRAVSVIMEGRIYLQKNVKEDMISILKLRATAYDLVA